VGKRKHRRVPNPPDQADNRQQFNQAWHCNTLYGPLYGPFNAPFGVTTTIFVPLWQERFSRQYYAGRAGLVSLTWC
jgi:hypothetical protein